jgi:hypothetical protein
MIHQPRFQPPFQMPTVHLNGVTSVCPAPSGSQKTNLVATLASATAPALVQFPRGAAPSSCQV